MPILAAPTYESVGDLAVITSYYNPAGFRTKPRNYRRFVAPLVGAVPCITVECAFGDSPFDLAAGPNVVQVRSSSVLWQKERLLNIALGRLPVGCTKVAWLDNDILFSNPAWAREASRLLETHAVVQPFSQVIRLPRGVESYDGDGTVFEGFAARLRASPHSVTLGTFLEHGHMGFAWAARREVLEHGLYDRDVVGGADHHMAHTFAGDWESGCIAHAFEGSRSHREHFEAWSRAVYPSVRARIGCVPGTVLHLWHGDFKHRHYDERKRQLAAFGFDPASDVRLNDDRCWEWSSDKPDLHRWVRSYFLERRDDGDTEVGVPSREELVDRIRRYADRARNAALGALVGRAERAEAEVWAAPTCEDANRRAERFFASCAEVARGRGRPS